MIFLQLKVQGLVLCQQNVIYSDIFYDDMFLKQINTMSLKYYKKALKCFLFCIVVPVRFRRTLKNITVATSVTIVPIATPPTVPPATVGKQLLHAAICTYKTTLSAYTCMLVIVSNSYG